MVICHTRDGTFLRRPPLARSVWRLLWGGGMAWSRGRGRSCGAREQSVLKRYTKLCFRQRIVRVLFRRVTCMMSRILQCCSTAVTTVVSPPIVVSSINILKQQIFYFLYYFYVCHPTMCSMMSFNVDHPKTFPEKKTKVNKL